MTASASRLGMSPGPIAAASGECLGKRLANLAEADNCVAHGWFLGSLRPAGSGFRMERLAGREKSDLRQAAINGNFAGGHEAAVCRGDSTLTRIPVPFKSSAQVRARLRTAALLAL